MLHCAPGTGWPGNMRPIYQTVVWLKIRNCARPRLKVIGDVAPQTVRSLASIVLFFDEIHLTI